MSGDSRAMIAGPGERARAGHWLLRTLELPLGGALLALAVVRIAASVHAACRELACDDFGRFWYATSGWLASGHSLYAPTPASMSGDGVLTANLNLPHSHLLLLPYALVPRNLGMVLWVLTGVVCVALSLQTIARQTSWRPSLGWAVVFLWWMPTHVQLVTGQVAWLLLLPVTMAWAAARRARWARSGAWVGVAIAIKPFLLPLLAWLAWRRQYRAVAAAIAAAGCIILAGVFAFGVDAYREWHASIASISWYARSLNASIWGEVYRLFTVNTEFAPVLGLDGWARLAAALVSSAVAVGAWLLCRRTTSIDHQWSVVMTATLLVCPLGWVYYGVLLLPGWKARWPGAPATACWLIPTPWLLIGQPSRLATLLWGSAATWGLILASVRTWRQAATSP